MDNEDLISQLADIHLPEAVSYWPPAPGWLILALMLLIAVIYVTIKGYRAMRVRRFCSSARSELEKCYEGYQSAIYTSSNPKETNNAELVFVNQLNSVLRRVALNQYPDTAVAGLSGQSWVQFLDSCTPDNPFPEHIALALGSGRFSQRCEIDVEEINQLASQWISRQYMNKVQISTQQQSAPHHA